VEEAAIGIAASSTSHFLKKRVIPSASEESPRVMLKPNNSFASAD